MRRCAGLWLVVFLALGVARPAAAFEFFDGALQIHGFGESIIRVLNNDFDSEYDLSQMQFVLNIEAELDIAPDGIGPFSAVSAYTRVEVRYDCVWSRACGLGSVDHLGNSIKRVPHHRSNGRETNTFSGVAYGKADSPPIGRRFQSAGRTVRVNEAGLFATAFETKGPDQRLGTNDDPLPLIFGKYQNYQTTYRKIPGSTLGRGNDLQIAIRPRDQIDETSGLFRFIPNSASPLEGSLSCRTSDAAPPYGCNYGWEQVTTFLPGGIVDSAGLSKDDLRNSRRGDIVFNPEALSPYRPHPSYSAETAQTWGIPRTEASGMYKPSRGLRRYLMNESQGPFDQNYSQNALAFNLGASQEDEWFVKEAYFDIEMLDGRLWFRIGKQTIVWGKTEIFRSQDQFNPQDVGLATLPSLEESRIGLWALRMTYSFYDVGPLQDVRLELAALVDEFEPVDLGTCGEPYVPNPVYGKCLGLFAHSAVGIGLAGETRPMNWWDSPKGLEFGARLEFRWRRFSFAFTDYYGFNDFPTAEVLYKYSRNVDPMTGRPRWGMTDERCDPEGGKGKGCLGVQRNDPYPEKEMREAGFNPVGIGGNCSIGFIGGAGCFGRGLNVKRGDEVQNTRILRAKNRNQSDKAREDILYNHSANQTFFDFACASSVGTVGGTIESLATECGLNVFGSSRVLETGFAAPFDAVPISGALSMILGGSSTLYNAAVGFLAPDAMGLLTTVPLNHNDYGPAVCPSGPICMTEWTTKGRTGEGFGQLYGDFSLDPTVGNTKPGNATNFLFALVGSLSSAFTPEQQALLGCGAYFASSCDRQGMDLLNAEASALFQSFPGFDGTATFGFNMLDKNRPAPGSVGFKGGPVCTRNERGRTYILPGCRGPEDPGYRRDVDGHPYFNEALNNADIGMVISGLASTSDLVNFNNLATKQGCKSILTTAAIPRLKSGDIRLFNPLNCQPFRSEMAAFSFNLLAVLVLFSNDSDNDGFSKKEDFDEFDPSRPFKEGRCSLSTPQFCSSVRGLLGVTGVGSNSIRAGGNWDYGRRDFTWHGGQELTLRYDRRNVLGFSTDFSEDWSKTNWGVEATWINNVRMTDRDAPGGLTDANVFNLTISMDRPTFINFLNANRTLLFNTQWFISYVPEHTSSFSANGPINVLGTFTALTGYFQDRLFAVLTLVYDFQSISGAGLPSISYRFNEAFSVQFGMAFFFGRYQEREPFLMPAALGSRVGSKSYVDHVENGLAVVRDRDEFFFRIRYTF